MEDADGSLLNDAQLEILRTLETVFPNKQYAYLKLVVHNANPELDVHALIDKVLGENLGDVDEEPSHSSKRPRIEETAFEPQPGTSSGSRSVGENTSCAEKIIKIQSALFEIFPNIDPEFIEQSAKQLAEKPQGSFDAFVIKCFEEQSSLPKKKKDPKPSPKLTVINEGSLSIETLLEKYNNEPEVHFSNKSAEVSAIYRCDVDKTLRSKFPKHSVRVITRTLRNNNWHYWPSFQELEKLPTDIQTKRNGPRFVATSDRAFKEEQFFIDNRDKIAEFKNSGEKRRREAIESGAIFECQCCFDDQVPLYDVTECDGEVGHWFCSSCVKAGVENQIGQNTTNTSCLADCAGKFSLQILNRILDPKVFAKFCQRVQEDELKMAEIEGLEFCVKCGHPNVCDEGNTVFTCINEECKKETCRLCKEDVHLPKRCDEVEKDVEVKQRTKIEEQMTEAMIRNCYNCKTPFIKEMGCNKMQCPQCHKKMCYICQTPVADYKHFYGQGSEPIPGRCPLYTDNQSLHAFEVLKAAEEAKKSIGETQLKNDPTQNLNLPQIREGFRIDEVYVQPQQPPPVPPRPHQ